MFERHANDHTALNEQAINVDGRKPSAEPGSSTMIDWGLAE